MPRIGDEALLHGTTPIERIKRSARCLNAANGPCGQLGNVFTSPLHKHFQPKVLFSVVWWKGYSFPSTLLLY